MVQKLALIRIMKINILKYLCFCFVLLTVTLSAQGQETKIPNDSLPDYFDEDFIRFDNYIYNENIHSIRLHKINDLLSKPVIGLNNGEQLKLSFDDLSDESKDYYYKLIHCTSNWEDSGLSYFDYINGFEENQIYDFQFSFNTFRNYCHYNLFLPNNDVKFKISGNYLVKVYEYGMEEKPAFTYRFMIYEDLVFIDANVKRSTILDEMNSHHEIDFILNSRVAINNPYNELKVVIAQNGRWDNRIENLQPKFIRNNELHYDLESDNSFPAGNEFRFFNCKDVEFKSQGIERIHYKKPWFYFELEKDKRRRFKVYFYEEDINGSYQVDMADASDPDTEADYVYVHFTLDYDAPVVDGNIYVFGALSDWGFTSRNKMKYNFDRKCYELKMLLKQGYYNYSYAFLKDGEYGANIEYIEGNHYETENDYQIFIYLKENSARFEKLIGFCTVNSLNKL